MPINLNKAAAQKLPAPAREFIPSPQQQAYFDWIDQGDGNAILEAVAGAGKTTTILKGVTRMKGKIWFGVYNKKMSDEVKQKIADSAELSAMRNFTASTFHSAGLRALRFAFGKNNTLIADDRKVKAIIKEMATELRTLAQSPDAPEDAGDWLSTFLMHLPAIAPVVSMAKNRGIGPVTPDTDENWIEMMATFGLMEALPETCDLGKFLGYCREVLRRNNSDLNTIDFDDMVYLPLVKKLRMLKYDWVLVDEAQDTNPTRRALASAMLSPRGRFVAVGDSRQAIFGFTGADNDSLEQLAETFQCERLDLTVTYRCPKAVVAIARQVVSHIEAHESAPDGEYRMIEEKDFAGEIARWNKSDYGQTAILCRNNQPLMKLCFALIRKRIPAKIEGKDIGKGIITLIKSWKASDLNTVRDRMEAYKRKELEKAVAAEDEARIDIINDQCGTINVLIEMCINENGHTTEHLFRLIESLFADNVAGRGQVTLCSAHKSKGLEWPRVYIWGRNRYMPSRWAREDWQIQQEENLIYVAVTRAMQTLVDIYVTEKEETEE